MVGSDDSPEAHLRVTRVVLRPIGDPLPLGSLAPTVATLSVSVLQLGGVPPQQGRGAWSATSR